ncbi:leucine-rich repeat-containing protein 19 [Bufo bufo]|uniref:leucine-rich repeat-containing protein 19 n=1 Tax=Bufo bufo TaxID=8384 RepID=UPI001ABEC31F|nr:leucine-rich repeat-containing protein 19 [Bufo bufo]
MFHTGQEATSQSFAKEVLTRKAEYKGHSGTRSCRAPSPCKRQCCNLHTEGGLHSQKQRKMHIILVICIVSLYNQVRCQDIQERDLSGGNLTHIPLCNSENVTKLILSQNNISLTVDDHQSLLSYSNLIELNLSQNEITELKSGYFTAISTLEVLILRNNHITSIEEKAFIGLKNLKILDLGFNLITHLPANIEIPSLHLRAFNLQNNSLTSLDIKEALRDLGTSLNITLSGNPWNCNCSLLSLSFWLNNSTVILENENITLCAMPKNMADYKIKEIDNAPSDLLSCRGGMDILSTPASLFENSTLVNTSINGTDASATQGNSWRFLVGVLIVGLVTSLLILIAVKFPRWYDFILSYHHQRLKEEEPYMFEEEFNVDFNMGTNDKNQDDIVVFEQTHSFVPEEDGFIEDKYIEEHDITASYRGT